MGDSYAVLIGINQYQALPDLAGAVNDVRLMRGHLLHRFGFPENNIVVLEDGAATRKAILEALEKITAKVQKNDNLYIHFSGHGSQTEDLDGDEKADQWDETIVPHDGRTAEVRDITDDEIRALLDGVSSRQVVIVFDSCHSGTATRGISELRLRWVPPDNRKELYAQSSMSIRGVVPLAEQRHILFTGAASTQSALDAPINGRSYGMFTYALGRALSSLREHSTALEIFERVEQELNRLKSGFALSDFPEPQLEGPADKLRLPLFSNAPATRAARRLWLNIESRPQATAALLDGRTFGVRPGAVWAIYPAEDSDFRGGTALARLRVNGFDGANAHGKLEPSAYQISAGDRAVEVLPAPPSQKVLIRWLGAIDSDQPVVESRLRERYKFVNFVSTESFSQLALELTADEMIVFAADGSTVKTRTSRTNVKDVADFLAPSIFRVITTGELLALGNPGSELVLRLEVATKASSTQRLEGTPAVRIVPNTNSTRYTIRRETDARTATNSLQFRVSASSDCYATLIDVDAIGNVAVIFPNAVSEANGFLRDGLLSAGETFLIPDSLRPQNSAGFHLDLVPPAGTDTVMAVCATNHDTARKLRTQFESLQSGNIAAGRTRAATRNVLTEQVREELAGMSTRGIAIVATTGAGDASRIEDDVTSVNESDTDQSSDWASASVTISISETAL